MHRILKPPLRLGFATGEGGRYASPPAPELKTVAILFVTALAELVGCYLPYLWLGEGKTT